MSSIAITIVGPQNRDLQEMLAPGGAKIQSQPYHVLAALASRGRSALPDAIVVDLRGDNVFPPAIALIRRQHPEVGVVIVASQPDPALMIEAMRAGVNEWVSEPISATTLSAAVQRVIGRRVSKRPEGQVFAFVGAKGGVGTTTVAVNVATALAKAAPTKALLVDMHLTHGDAALFLGAEPRFTISDALENIHRLDRAYLSGVVTNTKMGLDLLPSSERPVAPVDSAERVRELIALAAEHYHYLVLDVPRSDMTMLDSLELATSIIVIANQELATVRRAGTLAMTLRQRYGKDRVGVVINRFDRSAEIGREDVERVTGGSVRHVIPSDYRIALEGLNKGQPVVVENHNRLAGSFTSLARLLAGIESVNRKQDRPVGILGRLGVARS